LLEPHVILAASLTIKIDLGSHRRIGEGSGAAQPLLRHMLRRII
jgi:hypothetical protein